MTEWLILYVIVHLLIGFYMAMAVSLDARDEGEFATIFAFFLLFSFWSIPIIVIGAAAMAAWASWRHD